MIKTSTRQTYFLPVIGLVDPEDMKPGDLVGVNKDSYLILEKLPAEYDSRVKAMEVDSRYDSLIHLVKLQILIRNRETYFCWKMVLKFMD